MVTRMASQKGASLRLFLAESSAKIAAVILTGTIVILSSGSMPPKLLSGKDNSPPASGTIKGTVRFIGTVPKLDPLTVTKNPEVCGKTKPLDRLILGENNCVEYTLIYLKNPPPGKTAGPQTTPISINQQNCRYIPHMVIAAKGSPVEIINNDPVLHNCHGYYFADHSTAYNIGQPLKGQKTPQVVRKPGMIELQCDAGHVWMTAWIWVTESPYAAVTGENGEFTLKDVPPGTYTLVLWHEGWNITKTGQGGRQVFSAPIVQEKEVAVSPERSSIVNFELQSQ